MEPLKLNILGRQRKHLHAYVDGSYDPRTGVYGSGWVILEDNKVLARGNKGGKERGWKKLHNVAGELIATLQATSDCIANGATEVTIHHDYTGIATFLEPEYNPSSPQIAAYVQTLFSLQQAGLKLNFKWVKGHSGNIYNAMADRLAKDALTGGAKGIW